jgi:hypothetical protein
MVSPDGIWVPVVKLFKKQGRDSYIQKEKQYIKQYKNTLHAKYKTQENKRT